MTENDLIEIDMYSVIKQKYIERDVLERMLEKTYADFCECESGEGWLKIDGKEYFTDVGYAIDGMRIFMEVLKQRLAESEDEE